MFDKNRLFYTQGDYGLFQSTNPDNQKTYDNEAIVMEMMEAQGFVRDERGQFQLPPQSQVRMRKPVTSNMLADSIGSNPVTVRNLMIDLQQAGLIEVKRGTGGLELTRPLSEITFLDVYRAVETGGEEQIFHFHEHPNPNCPVGRNIHRALDNQLEEIQSNFEADLAHRTVDSVYEKIVAELRKGK
ncbi:MAG: Rrf2 family transcriptional regulator [Eggerthellaceae bacterium]|jgi:DNA-binding IscR family transcriptional regulator